MESRASRNARNERCAMRIARCSSLAPRWRGRRSTPAFRAGSEYWQQKVIFSSWLSLCVRWSKICVFRVPVWTPGRSRIGRVDGRAGAWREACCTLRLRNTLTPHEKGSKLKIVLVFVQSAQRGWPIGSGIGTIHAACPNPLSSCSMAATNSASTFRHRRWCRLHSPPARLKYLALRWSPTECMLSQARNRQSSLGVAAHSRCWARPSTHTLLRSRRWPRTSRCTESLTHDDTTHRQTAWMGRACLCADRRMQASRRYRGCSPTILRVRGIRAPLLTLTSRPASYSCPAPSARFPSPSRLTSNEASTS